MYPATTTYRLANAGGEFNKLYALMRKKGLPTRAGMLQFPTVVAERGGKIVGFLSTSSNDVGLWLGPLVCEGAVSAMRLVEAMEVVLSVAGVKAYMVAVDEDKAEALADLGFMEAGDGVGAVPLVRKL